MVASIIPGGTIRPPCLSHPSGGGVPWIIPPHGIEPAPRLPVFTVNGKGPDSNGNVDAGIPELEDLKDRVIPLSTVDDVFDAVTILAEAVGMKVNTGEGSYT